MSIPLRIGSLLLAVFLCAGQAPLSASAFFPFGDDQAGAPAQARNAEHERDEALAKKIRERFSKSKVSEDGITVRVSNGVAIIEGATAVAQRKGAATRMARTAGAEDVDNRITITKPGRDGAAGSPRRVHVRWERRETPRHGR